MQLSHKLLGVLGLSQLNVAVCWRMQLANSFSLRFWQWCKRWLPPRSLSQNSLQRRKSLVWIYTLYLWSFSHNCPIQKAILEHRGNADKLPLLLWENTCRTAVTCTSHLKHGFVRRARSYQMLSMVQCIKCFMTSACYTCAKTLFLLPWVRC